MWMMTDLEQSIAQLRIENQRLCEELTQAKTDKEFVWSLWKRLQVSSPDLTQAISLVVQREKEKAELKDAKVLQILQLKDKKIEELQSIVTKQSKELTAIIQQKSDLLDNVKRMEADVISSSERARQLSIQVMTKDSCSEERTRRIIDEYEKQKAEVSEQVSSLQSEVTRVKTDNGNLNAANIALDSRAGAAEREVARLRSELRIVQDDAGGRIGDLETKLSQALSDAESRRTEAIIAREELSKLLTRFEATQEQYDKQSALLSKMEAVEESKDTIIRSKDHVYTKAAEEMSTVIRRLESENRSLRRQLIRPAPRPRRVMDNVGAGLTDDDRRGAELCDDNEADGEGEDEEDELTAALVANYAKQRPEREMESESPVVDMAYRTERLEQQVRLLEDCVQRRDKIIKTLHDTSGCGLSASKAMPRRPVSCAYVRQNRASRLRTRSAPIRSARRCLTQGSLQRQLATSDKMVTDLENGIAEKEEELCTLRQAFDRRGHRLQSLKYSLRRLRSQMREFVENRDHDMASRAADAQVDAMVRELAALRGSYNKLVTNNSNLAEEVARLRDRSRDDEVTIREMQQMRARYDPGENGDARDKDRMAQEIDQAKLKIRLLEDQLSVVDRQNNCSMDSIQVAWDSERKGLKAEIESLAQDLSSKRIEIVTLKRNMRQMYERRNDENKSNSTKAMADILEHFVVEAQAEAEAEEEEEEEAEATEDTDSGGGIVAAPAAPRVSIGARPSLRPAALSSVRRRPVAAPRRRVHWRSTTGPRQQILEDLDRVPTRDGEPSSSDSARTRSDESQPSARMDDGVSRAAMSALRLPQSTILKRRLASLQQQLRAVRRAKKQSVVALSALQSRSREMSRELDLANSRARRLRDALDRVSRDRGLPPGLVMANNNAALAGERELLGDELSADEAVSDEGPVQPSLGHSEKEWRALAARAHASGQEVVRQAAVVRQLREEVAAKDARLAEIREKLTRAEKDASQKKSILEENRTKVKAVQESAKADRDELETTLQRLRNSRELAERQRVQLDSFRRRLTAVTDERRRYESEAMALREEMERKSKSASEAITKRNEMEKRMMASDKAAEEKLLQVVRRSEGAVDAARSKVAQLQARLSRCGRLLLRLGRAIVARTGEARSIAEVSAASRRLRSRADSNESMRAARERAADILNLSAEDVDDILHPEAAGRRAGAQVQTGDREWLRRCERLLANGGPADDEEAEVLGRSFEEKLLDVVSLLRTAVGVAQA